MKKNILLTPGPANTSDIVKQALIIDDICPREKEFWLLTKKVSEWLLDIINANYSDYVCVLLWWSWTLAMESVITSLPNVNDKILIIENWAYWKRFKDIANVYNIDYLSLDYERWKPILLEDVEKKLSENDIKYVFFTHMETTTWILNNLRKINKVIHKYWAISVVDAMSSFWGYPIDANLDEIDFLISSSNKCIGWMPWISFVIWKRKIIESLSSNPIRSYYSNLYLQYKYFEDNLQFRFTPPVQIVYSLKAAIEELKKEWWAKKRYERYTKNYELLKQWLKELWFRFLLEEEFESKILITVLEPKWFDFEEFHDEVKKYWITIYPWKLNTRVKSFRLSVLWNLYEDDINYVIDVFKKVLKNKEIKYD